MRAAFAVLAASVALAGCGGDSDDEAEPTPTTGTVPNGFSIEKTGGAQCQRNEDEKFVRCTITGPEGETLSRCRVPLRDQKEVIASRRCPQ